MPTVNQIPTMTPITAPGAISDNHALSFSIVAPSGCFVSPAFVNISFDGGATWHDVCSTGSGYFDHGTGLPTGYSGDPVGRLLVGPSDAVIFTLNAPPWVDAPFVLQFLLTNFYISTVFPFTFAYDGMALAPAPSPPVLPTRTTLGTVHAARYQGGLGVTFGGAFGASEDP